MIGHVISTENTKDIINSLKQSDIYTAEKKIVPVIHLKGVGRYCIQCNKKLQPKTITRNVNGKKFKVNIGVPETQVYCSKSCKNKKYYKKTHPAGNSIYCRINLNLMNDELPYLKMTIYLKKGISFDFKITKESRELWQYLKRFTRYKTLNVMQKTEEVILAR